MFDITMTINGKPASKANMMDALEQAMFETTVEAVKEKIKKVISAAEASQIKVDVVGKDISNLSLNINGPEEIVNKIQAALA